MEVVAIDITTRFELALEVVDEVGKLIVEKQNAGAIDVFFKEDRSPVTNVDREAEAHIRSRLLSKHPNDGFIGEELKTIEGTSGYRWSCDPIDGTWSYLNHEITCSICINLHQGDEVLAAIIYNPFTNQLYTSKLGAPATLNGNKLPTVHKTVLKLGVVNFQIAGRFGADINHLYELRAGQHMSKLVRLGGSIAYSLAQVAVGAHSVYIRRNENSSNIWDLAGGLFLIRQAGGLVTDLDGNDLHDVTPGEILVASTNPEIHKQILTHLNAINFGINNQ